MITKIILASASPRRKELLSQMGIAFDVVPSNINESFPQEKPYEEAVIEVALNKARDVADSYTYNEDKVIVIGADTIVVGDEIMGKPQDEDDAARMLNLLQGKTHEVVTGLAVIDPVRHITRTAFEKTMVHMDTLTSEDIDAYVKTGEPIDKAGAYGIQGKAGVFVRGIDGSYANVVGLPVNLLWKILKEFGINPLLNNNG